PSFHSEAGLPPPVSSPPLHDALPICQGGHSRSAQRWWVSLPARLLTGFLAISVVVVLALVVDQFRWWLVLPLAVVAVVLTRRWRSEEHSSELQSRLDLVCRLLLEITQ